MESLTYLVKEVANQPYFLPALSFCHPVGFHDYFISYGVGRKLFPQLVSKSFTMCCIYSLWSIVIRFWIAAKECKAQECHEKHHLWICVWYICFVWSTTSTWSLSAKLQGKLNKVFDMTSDFMSVPLTWHMLNR